MSELPAPRIAGIETPPKLESRPSRESVLKSLNNSLDGVPGLYTGYREEMAPLWDRLKRGDNLTPQERRDAIGYHVTMEGIKNITGKEPRPGEPSWPDNLATDEWTNEYKDENGNLVGKQREGLRIKHIDGWLAKKIEQAKADGKPAVAFVLEASKADLEASSATYAQLHSSPGSLDIETRKRQEARALIHASQETDEFGRQVRDSQIPQDNETNRAAHEREDWSFAEAELDGPNGEPGGALELVVPAPKAPEPPKLTNVPKLRVDETLPTERVEVPGSNGLPPIYVSGNSEDRSSETVDMGGGEVVVPPTEVVRTGVDVAPRSIPEALQGSGSSDYASYPAEGSGEGDSGGSLDTIAAGRERGDLGDASGAFYPEGDPRRYERPESGETGVESPEDAEAKAARVRGERLAKTGLGRRLWDRARGFISSRISSVDLPKIPTPPRPGRRAGLTAAALGLAILAMVVIDNCSGKPGQQGAATMPEQPDKPPTELITKPPSVPTGEDEFAYYDPNPQAPKPVVVEAQPASLGGGRSMDTAEQDFSAAGEKQSLKGIAEDQLAQLLSPEYKAYVDQMRGEGKVVEAEKGGSKDIMDKFKAKLIEQFGETEGSAKHEKIINDLKDQERFAIDNLNGPGGSKVGIGEDGDAIIRGPEWDGKLRLVDMGKGRDGVMPVVSGITGRPYSSIDDSVLDRYQISFNRGDNQ